MEMDNRPTRSRDRSSFDRDNRGFSGPVNNMAGLGMLGQLGMGQFGLLQQMNSKSDVISCSVFVSNVSEL